MSLTWTRQPPCAAGEVWELRVEHSHGGNLVRDSIKFCWRRWPHEDIIFHALSLVEGKEIAQGFWALQNSVGTNK